MFEKIYTESFLGSKSDVPFGLELTETMQGLVLHFAGTTVSGAFAPSQLGTIEFNTPSPHSNIPVSFLDFKIPLKGGIFRRDAASPGAFSWYVYWPFAFPGDNVNCLQVKPKDNFNFIVRPDSSLATAMGGTEKVTMNVYAQKHPGLQGYSMRMNRIQFKSLVGSKSLYINDKPDLVGIYVENHANLTHLKLTVDDDVFLNRTPKDVLLNQTHIDNEIESFNSSLEYIELDLNRNDDMDDIKNNKAVLEVEADAEATMNIVVVNLLFTGDRLRDTAALKRARKARQLEAKADAGDTRAIEVGEIVRNEL